MIFQYYPGLISEIFPLNYTTNPKLKYFLEDLSGTLHLIAHAGHSRDIEFIKRRQDELKRKYSKFFSKGLKAETPDDSTIEGCVYHEFMDILEDYPSSDDIATRCEEILTCNFPEGF